MGDPGAPTLPQPGELNLRPTVALGANPARTHLSPTRGRKPFATASRVFRGKLKPPDSKGSQLRKESTGSGRGVAVAPEHNSTTLEAPRPWGQQHRASTSPRPPETSSTGTQQEDEVLGGPQHGTGRRTGDLRASHRDAARTRGADSAEGHRPQEPRVPWDHTRGDCLAARRWQNTQIPALGFPRWARVPQRCRRDQWQSVWRARRGGLRFGQELGLQLRVCCSSLQTLLGPWI